MKKTKIFLIVALIKFNSHAQVCPCNEFVGSSIKSGGDDSWYWKMYREGSPSSSLNESLIFSRKRGSTESEHVKMILSGDGDLTLNSLKTGGSDAWYWRIYRVGSPSSSLNESLVFSRKRDSNDSEQVRMVLTQNGRLGIGTTNPDTELSVNGTIHTKEVKVDLNGWPDFVFEKDYDLRNLKELEEYINENKHLPKIPSEAEVNENGINLGEMNSRLLQKIEELTLYMIDMNKRISQLEQENSELREDNIENSPE